MFGALFQEVRSKRIRARLNPGFARRGSSAFSRADLVRRIRHGSLNGRVSTSQPHAVSGELLRCAVARRLFRNAYHSAAVVGNHTPRYLSGIVGRPPHDRRPRWRITNSTSISPICSCRGTSRVARTRRDLRNSTHRWRSRPPHPRFSPCARVPPADGLHVAPTPLLSTVESRRLCKPPPRPRIPWRSLALYRARQRACEPTSGTSDGHYRSVS